MRLAGDIIFANLGAAPRTPQSPIATATSPRAETMAALPDDDPQETNEWLDALDGLLQHEGPERAHYILEKLLEKARRSGVFLPYSAIPLLQHHPARQGGALPGRTRTGTPDPPYVRWNAAAMVLRAKTILGTGRPHRQLRLGGDTLRCRLQSFWHAPSENQAATWCFSRDIRPGVYARAFMLAADQGADGQLRQEVEARSCLVSAPVADAGLLAVPDRLDGDWDRVMAIYQARFMKYCRTAAWPIQRAARSGASRRRRGGRAESMAAIVWRRAKSSTI